MGIISESVIEKIVASELCQLADKSFGVPEIAQCMAEFTSREVDYKMLLDQVSIIVDGFIREKLAHSTRRRTKEPKRLVEKIVHKVTDSKKKVVKVEHLFSGRDKITDYAGVRILHLYKEHWIGIHRRLTKKKVLVTSGHLKITLDHKWAYVRPGDDENEYRKSNRFKKEEIKSKEESRYTSLHYIFRCEIEGKDHIYVEIQVRTVFEEGWGEIDHQRRYSSGSNPLNEAPLRVLNYAAQTADKVASSLLELEQFPKFISWDLEQKYERASDKVFVLSRDLAWAHANRGDPKKKGGLRDQVKNSSTIFEYLIPECYGGKDLARHLKDLRTFFKSEERRIFFRKVPCDKIDFRAQFSDIILMKNPKIDGKSGKDMVVVGSPMADLDKIAAETHLDLLIEDEQRVNQLSDLICNALKP